MTKPFSSSLLSPSPSKSLRPLELEGSARLILALDVPSLEEARSLVAATAGTVGVYKIGLQLLCAGGLSLAEALASEGYAVFLDMKLLDIGNTVAEALRCLTKIGIRFLTVHAYPQTMRAAVAVLKETGSPLCLLAVSVLTSLTQEDLAEAGYTRPLEEIVVLRAQKAIEIGMGGVVCSAHEVVQLRPYMGPKGILVVPGIRPEGSERDDQSRSMTPFEAIRGGADYLVVGRPILRAPDPRSAAQKIAQEITEALMQGRTQKDYLS